MKCKMLFSDADRIVRMITKDIKNGKVKISKQGDIDVDKIPYNLIEQKDKKAELVSMGVSGMAAMIGFLALYDLTIGIVMFCTVFVFMFRFYRPMILYPLYFVRWNSSTPFKMAEAKPRKKFRLLRRSRIGKMKIQTKDDEYVELANEEAAYGDLEFIELAVKEAPEGIPTYTPESFRKMSENATLRELLTSFKKVQTPWMMMIVMLVLGFALCAMLFPNGIQAAMNAAGQAAGSASNAVVPPTGG